MAEVLEANGHALDVVAFRKALIAWGRQHVRPLPWRLTSDPYRILMAEVMLHRTQAAQVVPVYERFIEHHPDVPALARAGKGKLHDSLRSLGLRWRIDLIYDMAGELMGRFAGQVPDSREDLLSLPGVSQYTASAVRCFAWNLPEALLDTNTVRVVGRLFGLEVKDSSRRNRRFRELVSALVHPDQPRAYNYALIDFADQVCMKKRPPKCFICPVCQQCMHGALALADPNTRQRN